MGWAWNVVLEEVIALGLLDLEEFLAMAIENDLLGGFLSHKSLLMIHKAQILVLCFSICHTILSVAVALLAFLLPSSQSQAEYLVHLQEHS